VSVEATKGAVIVVRFAHQIKAPLMNFMRHAAISTAFAIALLPAGTSSQSAVAADDTVNRDFAECLMSHVRTGKYQSTTAAQATVRLLGDCASEWEAFANVCVRRNASDLTARKNCNLKGSLLAAVALKMGNNPDTRAWDNFVDQFNAVVSSGR
jgi:hypothetical protein